MLMICSLKALHVSLKLFHCQTPTINKVKINHLFLWHDPAWLPEITSLMNDGYDGAVIERRMT